MYVVMTDSFPGYWGSGDTEDEALTNCKKSGGRPSKTGTVRFRLHEMYHDPAVDMMGGLSAHYKGDPEDTDRPGVVAEAWRVGPRGKRTPITF
jgi:hypothetical protein